MKSLDGDNVLYHYFKQDLINEENPESEILIRKLLKDLSVWLPVELYKKLPVLLPFVIRDPKCRKAVNKIAEEWGTCNSDGYFRDDNTLIKSIPRAFEISAKNRIYDGSKLGNGFVACHIWRVIPGSTKLASTVAELNSFVPNLVWLPRQISKFTDREGSYAQRYLKSLSHEIYRNNGLDSRRKGYVENIWERLKPDPNIRISSRDIEDLNFFQLSEEDICKRQTRLLTNIDLIVNPQNQKKVYCSRYLTSLEKIDPHKKQSLIDLLQEYVLMIKAQANG